MDEVAVPERRGAPLTRASIIEAGLAIIDDEGLPALNMRRLGSELGVKAMAVYKHFPNKDAILDGIVAAVLSDLAETAGEGDWREEFRATFLSLRALLRAHPNALPLVASRPLSSPRMARRLETVRDLLLAAGLPEEKALHLLHAGISQTLGYLWLEAGGFIGELPDDMPFLRRAVTAARTANTATLAAATTWSRDQDFAEGLELLIGHGAVPNDDGTRAGTC
jgi:AcrR family transcriptional regulator